MSLTVDAKGQIVFDPAAKGVGAVLQMGTLTSDGTLSFDGEPAASIDANGRVTRAPGSGDAKSWAKPGVELIVDADGSSTFGGKVQVRWSADGTLEGAIGKDYRRRFGTPARLDGPPEMRRLVSLVLLLIEWK